MNISELLAKYITYVGKTESPLVYHRWAFIGCLSAALNRNVYFPMGHFRVYPNLYILLMGDPGARKSTAINIGKDLLKRSGFKHFAGTQVSKERFLQDLETSGFDNLYSISQQFICADEFNNFIGEGNSGFISALTELFDAKDEYEARFKNSKSSIIPNPCVGILGANTQQAFSTAFPPAILHNGFLSRLLLVWGQPTREKVPWLNPPDEELRDELVAHFVGIQEGAKGQLGITPEARDGMQEVYRKWEELEDGRFITYAQRRYVHFIKLCVVSAASVGKLVVEYSDIVFANTMLASIEHNFGRALGEFGKSKTSEEASIVMNALYNAKGKGVSLGELWRKVQTSLAKFDDLRTIVTNLIAAGKIKHEHELLVAVEVSRQKLPHVNYQLLNEFELKGETHERVTSITR